MFCDPLCSHRQGGPTEKSLTHVPEKGKASGSQAKLKTSCRLSKDAGCHSKGKPKQDSTSPPSHHRSTGSLQFPKSTWFQSSDPPTAQRRAGHSEGTELKQSSPAMFYKPSGPSLSLFKRQPHSVEEQLNAKLLQRRQSEPGQQVVERAGFTRARLPSDPGLKVSEVDSQGETSVARFCLSPCATKAVRDYFSSHPHSNPHSSQQVALALVENHREWLKRCSNPAAEPDFEQLLFAEESYV